MKRSEINRAIRRMEEFSRKQGVSLPPFCNWTPEKWRDKGHAFDQIRDNLLGWDITDYGTGDFFKTGFTLITLRNGNVARPERYPKPYAEKLLMLEEGQYSPMHFHWKKMEDIINRGGGSVFIRVFRSTPQETFDNADVQVFKDGHSFFVPAGTQVRLDPGESISIYPYLYHDFEVVPGTGAVLLGEVSMCNDDERDNRFYEPMGRFPEIEEDEAPYRLLCTEYPKAADI